MFDVPFNTAYTFDDNLHEVPVSVVEMQGAIDYLEDQLLHEQDAYNQMALMGQIGTYYRILRVLDRAEAYIGGAVAIANDLRDHQARIANLLRLAHVHQWQGNYALADRIFKQVIETCEADQQQREGRRVGDYLHFAYQHFAKCKFDQADFATSAALFEKALRLRQTLNDADLIASTQYALDVVQARLTSLR